MKEIKVKNVKFNQKYMINEEGQIWSPFGGGKFLSPSPTQKGYYRIVLQTSNGRKTFQLHRLVLETFRPIENPEDWEVNHIDGDKSNNHLSNLEWCSGSFNVRHCFEMGLKIPAQGEQVAGHVLTEKQVLEICELLKTSNFSLREIGEKYGVSKYCIHDIKRKKSWSWLTKDYTF